MQAFSIAQIYILFATFVWIGFVGAISFMESWVKFRAPNVSLSIGLGIGRLVFKALNYVEWFFAVTIGLAFLFDGMPLFAPAQFSFLIVLGLIVSQSLWMLPKLDTRAVKIIAGEKLEKSSLHYYYAGAELLKIVCLIIFGITLVQT